MKTVSHCVPCWTRHSAVIALSLLAACGPRAASEITLNGRAADPERGRSLAASRGCGACHTIPGVHNANGLVGPPLAHWSERTFIAGLLPNTPEQLERWIARPQSVKPGDAMPNLALPDSDAADLAAFLFTRE
jgi:cytochrome c1